MCCSTMTGPVGVEGLTTRSTNTFIRVCSKEVSLCLQEIGGKSLWKIQINTNSRKVGMTLEIGRRRRGERRNEDEEKEG